MAVYKRINQLKQSYLAGDNDFLAIDIQGLSETQKIKKSDLFYNYIKDAPNDNVTKTWVWARKNGGWYRIYPDEYVFEAPIDGNIYVRINGRWAKVEGVNGDMLQSIYDTHHKSTDIFDYVDESVGIPDNATEALFGAPIVKRGESIEKDFCLDIDVLNLIVKGETNQILKEELLQKSFDNKGSLSGIENFTLLVSGKNLFKHKEMLKGSYLDSSLESTIHTKTPAKVNSGEQYTIKNGFDGVVYRFISVNRLNEPDNVFSTGFLTINDSITIPNGVDYIGIECKYGTGEGDNLLFEKIEGPYNSYVEGAIICYNNQYKEYFVECNQPLYFIKNDVYDYIDFATKKEIHSITKKEVTYEDNWQVSSIGEGSRSLTIPFELEIGNNVWLDTETVYGDSDALVAKSLDQFAITDSECIAFNSGKIYIRLLYDRIGCSIGQSAEEYLNGLQGFLYQNPFFVIYQNTDINVSYDLDLENIKTFDSITNFLCKYSFTWKEETYNAITEIEGKFNSAVNGLIRKSGDEMLGDLSIDKNHRIITNFIDSTTGNDGREKTIHINKDNNGKVFVNGENPILDLRDFTTNINWEAKVKTIEDKEANDKRIVNAEYVHRDYAPINNPVFTGIPKAPKAEMIGTDQIATGEFIAEHYYNKNEADTNYIKSVDGEASGELVLNETLSEIIENKKRIPNLEYIEAYYYNKRQTAEVFATLDSPIFTGLPTVPTPDGSNISQIVNVDYANKKIEEVQVNIDRIPKYKYLKSIEVEIQEEEADTWPSQEAIDAKVTEELNKVYPNPSLWDAVSVALYLRPSDKKRDLFYYYNDGTQGIKGWHYLYDLSTTINRANGDVAGIVANSDNGDITFVNGDPTVHHSERADSDSDGNKINSTYLKLSGGILTGKLILDGAPQEDNGAATKKYVDDVAKTSGSVKTVNGQGPDENGNIELDIDISNRSAFYLVEWREV